MTSKIESSQTKLSNSVERQFFNGDVAIFRADDNEPRDRQLFMSQR